jgi:hypothetical protein
MMARIGVRALSRHVERVFNPDRKDPHWRKRNDGNPSRLDTQRGCYPSAGGRYGADRWRDRSESRSHHVCSSNTCPQSSDQAETVNIPSGAEQKPAPLLITKASAASHVRPAMPRLHTN